MLSPARRTCLILTTLLLSSRLPAVEQYHDRTSGEARLVVEHGLAVAILQGDGLAMANQLMALCPVQVALLTRQMAQGVDPEALGHIPQAYRPELTALARGVGLSPEALATANLLVDSACTAIAYADPAAPGHLLMARNMDFQPADLLGPMSLVTVYRRPGVHAFASVGWPGFIAVVSGINDAGVAVCILLNLSHAVAPAGEPICFRLREILEQATTVEQAVTLFNATPVASSHFVIIADATSAQVVWQERDAVHHEPMTKGWISCTNGARGTGGHAADPRGRWVAGLCGDIRPDPAWMRRALTGCYLTGENAQSMVFIPGTLSLELALGSRTEPAALANWGEIPLGPLFQGAAPGKTLIQDLGIVPDPLTHYSHH